MCSSSLTLPPPRRPLVDRVMEAERKPARFESNETPWIDARNPGTILTLYARRRNEIRQLGLLVNYSHDDHSCFHCWWRIWIPYWNWKYIEVSRSWLQVYQELWYSIWLSIVLFFQGRTFLRGVSIQERITGVEITMVHQRAVSQFWGFSAVRELCCIMWLSTIHIPHCPQDYMRSKANRSWSKVW